MSETAEFDVEKLFKYLMRNRFRSYDYYSKKLPLQDKVKFIELITNDKETTYKGYTADDPYWVGLKKAKDFLFKFHESRIKGNSIISPITYLTQLSPAEYDFISNNQAETDSISDEYVLYQNNGLRGVILLRFEQIFEEDIDPFYSKDDDETFGLPVSVVCSYFENQKLNPKQQVQIYSDVYAMLLQEQSQINP